MTVARLICPVRDCGRPLDWGPRTASCAAGHSFDQARSGYLNLMQPQDRRAAAPGDSREVVNARRRLLDRGLGALLRDELELVLSERDGAGPRPPAMLDAGCGEGTHLAELRRRLRVEAWGVDISAAAIDLAARRHPTVRWIVANADRRLPFADGSFGAVMTITGPKNPPEFARLIAPAGLLVVVVSGPDDLAELREAILGAAFELERTPRMVELFGDHFVLEGERDVRSRMRLDRAELRDLLAITYRGARHRERERAEALDALEVTLSWRVLSFRPRPR